MPEWTPKKVDALSFPDQPDGNGTPPTTIANVAHLLAENGIAARYNLVRKKFEIAIPDLPGVVDNGDSVALAHVRSLLALHGMYVGDVRGAVEAIANQHPYSPVLDWIDSKPWDGKDRLPEIYETITAREGYPEDLKQLLMRKWLLSAAGAAVMAVGFSARGVFVLQGPQSIGKTRWGMSLVPDPRLRAQVVKTDHHFDGSKDSIIGAIRSWICELGELESSLRKDKERLKGFVTRDRDSIRLPYAAAESELPRRTVFYATANGSDFLTDDTGSTRMWVIQVASINYNHDVDMQQLFAQLVELVRKCERWWLNPEQEAMLEAWNDDHRAVSVVSEAVLGVIETDPAQPGVVRRLTALELLQTSGMEHPTTNEAREAGAILRKHFGDPKKNHGRMRFKIKLRKEPDQPPEPEEQTKSKYD